MSEGKLVGLNVLAAALAAAVWLLAVPSPGLAQQTTTQPAKAPAANAVGITSSWSTETAAGSATGIVLNPQQLDLVNKISSYFNAIGDLQGKFQQTDAQQQVAKGYFYLKRPGLFRFVYAPPSKLVILSDGEYLSYEDYDLKSLDRYPVESTPFRMLLEATVDLSKDANIVELTEASDLVTLSLHDKSDDGSGGSIKLFFARTGDVLELKEWVITTPQGGDTRVEVAELVRDKQVDPGLFKADTTILLPSSEKKN